MSVEEIPQLEAVPADTERPDVSVVIATWNAAETLEACLTSIEEQRGVGVQLVVADGGSTDDTVRLLEQHADAIDWWHSAKDRGIYDAWNTALAHTTGRWILFFGADDVLASPDALAGLVAAAQSDADANLICGRAQYLTSDGTPGREFGLPWSSRRIRWRQAIAHPATLQRRDLFERFGVFDPDLRIAGDYDFLLRIAPHVRAVFHDEIVSLLGPDGVSLTLFEKIRREHHAVQRRNPHSGPIRGALWRLLLEFAALRRRS